MTERSYRRFFTVPWNSALWCQSWVRPVVWHQRQGSVQRSPLLRLQMWHTHQSPRQPNRHETKDSVTFSTMYKNTHIRLYTSCHTNMYMLMYIQAVKQTHTCTQAVTNTYMYIRTCASINSNTTTAVMTTASAVHSYDLYHIHLTSFSLYNGYKLNSHLTCFQRGFIAQLVEHRTIIAEIMGWNPVGASEYFFFSLFV